MDFPPVFALQRLAALAERVLANGAQSSARELAQAVLDIVGTAPSPYRDCMGMDAPETLRTMAHLERQLEEVRTRVTQLENENQALQQKIGP
jgi:hypothetical protein